MTAFALGLGLGLEAPFSACCLWPVLSKKGEEISALVLRPRTVVAQEFRSRNAPMANRSTGRSRGSANAAFMQPQVARQKGRTTQLCNCAIGLLSEAAQPQHTSTNTHTHIEAMQSIPSRSLSLSLSLISSCISAKLQATFISPVQLNAPVGSLADRKRVNRLFCPEKSGPQVVEWSGRPKRQTMDSVGELGAHFELTLSVLLGSGWPSGSRA